MIFQNTNGSGERVMGGNRPGINSSGAMITKKPNGGFTSVANHYNQNLQGSNIGASVGGKVVSLLNNNNFRSPSPTF